MDICGECKFAKIETTDVGSLEVYCRRYPPVQWRRDANAEFPQVFAMAWCGEFVHHGIEGRFAALQKEAWDYAASHRK